MKIFNSLNVYGKIALILFILGKLSFLPTIASLFLENNTASKIMFSFYCLFIFSSISLSLISMNKIKRKELSKEISNYNDGSFLIKVKDGKIIEVL